MNKMLEEYTNMTIPSAYFYNCNNGNWTKATTPAITFEFNYSKHGPNPLGTLWNVTVNYYTNTFIDEIAAGLGIDILDNENIMIVRAIIGEDLYPLTNDQLKVRLEMEILDLMSHVNNDDDIRSGKLTFTCNLFYGLQSQRLKVYQLNNTNEMSETSFQEYPLRRTYQLSEINYRKEYFE